MDCAVPDPVPSIDPDLLFFVRDRDLITVPVLDPDHQLSYINH